MAAPSIIILGDLLIGYYFPSSVIIGAWLKSFWINEQSVISPIVSLFAFFVATFGLFLAGRRTQEFLNQNKIAERGQVIERFTRAVEQLGHGKQEVRIGGLYALGRIAEESPEERRQVIEILAGFVRSKAAIEYKEGEKDEEYNPIPVPSKLRSEKIDVETAVKILADIVKNDERWVKNEEEVNQTYLVDLSKTDLRDLFLERKNLRCFDFQKTLLSDTANPIELQGARLMEAFLVNADLTGANLTDANLTDANLIQANLAGAKLNDTYLVVATLISADLRNANLTSADLSGANLTSADLMGADLTGANLWIANLTSASMRSVQGLTQEQIKDTHYQTGKPPELPTGLVLPQETHNILKPGDADWIDED